MAERKAPKRQAPKTVAHPAGKAADGPSNDAMLVAHLQEQLDETTLSFETVNDLLGRRTNEVFTANKEQRRAQREADRSRDQLNLANQRIAELEAELRTFKGEEEQEEGSGTVEPVGRLAQLPPARP